jgi:hypothetical protein
VPSSRGGLRGNSWHGWAPDGLLDSYHGALAKGAELATERLWG